MDIRQEIKSYLALTGWTMTDIAKELNKRNNTDKTVQNLSNKLAHETIQYKEVKEIADIIGANIKWEFE